MVSETCFLNWVSLRMVKLCLMASYGYPLGFSSNPELGSCRVSKVRASVDSYGCDLKLLRFYTLVYWEFNSWVGILEVNLVIICVS